MKHPLDSSDEASLILADYLEEYDDINLANEVRESVLEPFFNSWCYDSYLVDVGSIDCGIGGYFSGVGTVFGVDVGSAFNVGGGFNNRVGGN